MRLADFILENLEPILAEWEAFARSLPAGHDLSSGALRQDAERMLRFIAADMKSEQSPGERARKARGHATEHAQADRISAGHDIGFHRQAEGFDLPQVVAEYRSLRASVVHLWSQQPATENAESRTGELIRFNESVDQVLFESVQRFVVRMDRSRELLLAVLAHDLRNPLSAIVMSAHVLAKDPALSEPQRERTQNVIRSATRMRHLLSDLLDFTRTRLGATLTLRIEQCNLCHLGQSIVDEVRAVYPDQALSVHCTGNGVGEWDQERISQLVANLVVNAIEHGDRDSGVSVEVLGDHPDFVEVSVHNRGPAIAPSQRKLIFDPFARAASEIGRTAPAVGSLGLGLYIAKEIADTHRGTIEIASTDETGTTFTARLPRSPS